MSHQQTPPAASSQPAPKVASHDLQLAVLVSMGFDAVPAEDALKRNNWKVGDSIDYLLAAGISMNDSVVGDGDDDTAKSVERRRLESASMTSQLLTPIRERRERPGAVSIPGRRPQDAHPVPLVDDWIEEEPPPVPTTTSRTRRHEGYSRSNPDRQRQREAATRQSRPHQYHLPRHDPMEEEEQVQIQPPQQARNQRQQVARAPSPQEDYELQHYRQQLEPPFPHGLYDVVEDDRKPSARRVSGGGRRPENSFEDRPARGSGTGTPHGVQTSIPNDDSVLAVADSGRHLQPAEPSDESLTPATTSSTHDRHEKQIRRLYILVLIAMVLVVIVTVVSVTLVLTLGTNNTDTPAAAPSPAPRPTTDAVTLSPTTAASSSKTPLPTISQFNAGPTATLPPPVRNNATEPTLAPGQRRRDEIDSWHLRRRNQDESSTG